MNLRHLRGPQTECPDHAPTPLVYLRLLVNTSGAVRMFKVLGDVER